MTRLGKALLTDSEILSLDQIAERVDAVSQDDVRELARKVFDPGSLTVVGIGADDDIFREAVPPPVRSVVKQGSRK